MVRGNQVFVPFYTVTVSVEKPLVVTVGSTDVTVGSVFATEKTTGCNS